MNKMPNLTLALFTIITLFAGSVSASPSVNIVYKDGEGKEQAAQLLADKVLEDGVEFINEAFESSNGISLLLSVPKMARCTILQSVKFICRTTFMQKLLVVYVK